MQIKIIADAHTQQAQAQFAALTKQVEALNSAMAKSAMIPQGGNPAGFARASRAANAATASFNHALASSGAFRVEQLKINDAVAKNTELLQRQKLGFHQTFGKKSRDMMRAVYREQLAMQQAVARTHQGMVGDGKTRMSIGVPTEVSKSWDTLNNRIGMFRTRLSSASSELVNWGKNTQWAGRQLMAGISMPVAAFGAAAGVMAYQVDKQMTRIAKVYDTTADQNSNSLEQIAKVEKELQALREEGMKTATRAAHAYGASVTDTLEVQAELAATGQTGIRLQQSTAEVMRISALGEIEHAEATKALISLQAVLGHTAKETADDFNYLNAIENATSLSTNDFVAAIPRALGPMKEMGGSLQDLAILMVAMKERGIQAGEGANAIKAMMQRLYRPSAQVREEWEKIANVDPMKFVEESGGNVMEILPKIAEATKDLGKADRVKLLAGLFGTYQVTRMSAMLKGLDDMTKGVGQVSRVLEVNQQGIEEWAKTSENEMQRQAESASGRFKRVWEGMKAELAALGEPFLAVASKFLELTSAVLGFVNRMPGWAKKGLIFGAMLAAIVGPVVMLVGLFANFAGNMGKFVAWSMKAVTSFEFMTKSQWAAKVSAELANKAFMNEATSAQILTTQMKGLALASEQSALAMSHLAGIRLPPGFGATLSAAGLQTASSMALGSATSNKAKEAIYAAQTPANLSQSNRLMMARNRMAEEYMVANNQVARDSGKTAQRQAMAARSTERMKTGMGGAAVAGGVMAASMGLMMLDINETSNSIAKWAMLGSIVVPAAVALVPLVQSAAASSALYTKNLWGASVALRTNVGLWGATLATMRGAATGILALMGPIGWATAAIGTIGFVAYKWHKSNQEEMKKQIDQQKAMNVATSDWTDLLGVAAKKRRELSLRAYTAPGERTSFDMAEEFKESETGKDFISAYGDASSDEQKTAALGQYVKILSETNATAEEARRGLEIMFIAAGDGALLAQTKAKELADTYGNLDDTDFANMWSQEIRNSMSGLYEEAVVVGTRIGETVATEIANSTSGVGKEAKLDTLAQTLDHEWNNIISGMQADSRRLLSDMGIEGRELKTVLADYKEMVLLDPMREDEFYKKYDLVGKDMFEVRNLMDDLSKSYAGTKGNADKLRRTERGIVKYLAQELEITRDITTLAELRATWEWRLHTATKANSEELYKQRILELEGTRERFGILGRNLGLEEKLTDQEKLKVLNQIRWARGMGEVNSLAAMFTDESKQGTSELGRQANAAKKVGRELNAAYTFSGDDAKSILRSGYAGVQEDLSNMISEDFDRNMASALDANSNHWDSAIERMENAQQAASDRMDNRHELEQTRFENRWERRSKAVEKAFDNRIDKVNEAIEAEQKAEEIRQRIFEAEQARLDRLTEAANRTIDFNMAMQTGDLDEAAKIRNDMEAVAQEWALSDGAKKGASQSQRRQERLQDRADAIGERKDEVLERLKEREEAEQRSMEKRQAAEKKHLDKVQKMNLDALNAQAEAAKENFEAEWEARKDSLDKQLDAFKSFVPKNQKQLRAWMKEMGIDYENFGLDVLRPKSEKWGNWFKNSLHNNIQKAGREIASDNMWETMGGKVAKKTLLGMGFGSMAKFRKFVMTGELPADFGQVRRNNKQGPGKSSGDRQDGGVEYRHEGGIIGGAGSSRSGVARNLKGLHSSETLVRAQRGEFMVNRDSAKRYGNELNAINNGVFDPMSSRHEGIMGGAGGGSGLAGLMAGALSKMLTTGVARAMQNAYQTKFNSISTFGTPKAGDYGGTAFTAEQLKNAATIASVGKSLGASSRDIVIALMTAMQESTLRNLDYGHLDSVGLFQQRDAWGSFAARTNPEQAARMFFTGGAQGQRGLFDFPDRGRMSLAEAAQAVQVSAYPDAYAKWAEEAQAIFKAIKTSPGSGSSGFVMGDGKKHTPVDRPWTSSYNIHGSPPAVDLSVPVGRNVYAPADGRVLASTDIRGYEPRAPHGGLGYKSYGRYIVIAHDNGASTLSAHLSERFVNAGQRVTGGSVIGKSGDTGYSYGPHVHFGASNGPLAWLKTGGQTLNDGIAMLHRGETVLTEPLSNELQHAVRAFGKAGKEKLSGKKRNLSIDPSERNMWGAETARAEGFNSSFWTYLNSVPFVKGIVKAERKAMESVTDTGAKGTISIGTLNTHAGVAAANTQKDLARLIGKTDFLALTEVTSKFDSLKRWLAERNWGLLGGKGREQRGSVLAYNKATQSLQRSGIRKLGDKTNNSIIGGPMKRYANYGLFEDKESGRKTWQVSAHTVPTPRMSAKHRPLFMEQWGNLDKLVGDLKGSGAPVFVAGDLNNNPNRNWWRTPGGLKEYKGMGVDWIFGDPKMSKALGMQMMGGMHTDHKGAVIANFALPSHKNGAENIKWDNTLVNMHKKESILTADQSDKFRKLADNIDNVAAGGSNEYNVNVYVTEPSASAEEITNKVVGALKKIESRKPQRRRS